MTVKELRDFTYGMSDSAEVNLLHVGAPLRVAQDVQDIVMCKSVAGKPEKLILMYKTITPDDIAKIRKEGNR